MFVIFYPDVQIVMVFTMVKLKQKLIYGGHVYHKAVRPDIVTEILHYLKKTIRIAINEAQITGELLFLLYDQNESSIAVDEI